MGQKFISVVVLTVVAVGGGGGGGLGSGEYACMLDLAWKTVSYDEFIPSNRVILLNEKVTGVYVGSNQSVSQWRL